MRKRWDAALIAHSIRFQGNYANYAWSDSRRGDIMFGQVIPCHRYVIRGRSGEVLEGMSCPPESRHQSTVGLPLSAVAES